MKSIVKICYIAFVVTLLFFSKIQAQKTDRIDSLTIELNKAEGSKRIPILSQLARFLKNKDQKKTIDYLNESLTLSEKYHDSIHLGISYTLLGDVYTLLGNFDNAQQYLEKAEIIFSTIESKKDEARLYGYFGELYIRKHNYKDAEEYYQKSLSLSTKIQDTKGIAWASNNLVSVYIEKGEIEKAKTFAYNALQLAQHHNDKNLQINLHVKIAGLLAYQHKKNESINQHYNQALQIAIETNNPRAISGINIQQAVFLAQNEQYEESEKYYLAALKICQEKEYHYRIILIYSNLGHTEMVKGEYKKSLDYFTKALNIAKRTKNEEREAKIYILLGRLHIEQGEYQKSIELLYNSLAFYEKLEDKTSLANVHTDIGEAFYLLNDTKIAEENYQKAFKVYKNLKLKNGIASTYVYLGKVKIKEENYAQAKLYLDKSYAIIKETGNILVLFGYYNAMADCLQSQKKYNQALTYINKVLEKENELKEYKKIAIESYTKAGTLYYDIGDYKTAVSFFHKSLKPSIRMKSRMEIKNNYLWLSKCYEKLNQYEKGLEYYKKHAILKDSVFDINKIKHIADIHAKYDNEKKEKKYREILQNSLQVAEKEIQNGQIKIQKSQLARESLLRNIAIGGGILILMISFFVLMYYKQRLKTQNIIAKKEIEAITATTLGKEKERIRIAKELHDGIGGNLAAIKLDLSKFSDDSDPDLQKIIQNIDGTYNEVRTLSHDLIPEKIASNTFEKIIKDYLDDLSNTCCFDINKDFYPKSKFDQLADKIKIELYRMTQELMNNIIKHANAERVDLQYTILNEQIKFIIEDDGIGFDQEKASKGIGLSNILSRVQSLKGNMRIDTLINRGTIVEINIPIA